MLIHDAEISVTSIVSPNKAPKTVSSKIEFNFLHNGFPTIIFKLDQYLSTLMMSTNAVQLFTTISYRDAEDGKPVWIKAFALHRVRYLNKVLTNIGEHPIINLSTLQNTYLERTLRIACILSEDSKLTSEIFNTKKEDLQIKNFISHQLSALKQYENRLLEFWGAITPEYSELSMRTEMWLIKIHFINLFNICNYKVHKGITIIKQSTFTDYERLVIRLTKPLIPLTLWSLITSLYRKIKQFK